ncbi:MAG: hypothetical protein SH868_06250 [Bythopirellula sp.]|nr:hypothetical protein [Bythopirellula sp.]
MKTFLQCCATGLLGLLATQAYTQNPEGVPPVDAEVPSEQGSQLTDDPGGYYPDDESPWFSAEGLNDELELDDDQVERLNQAYGATWKQLRANGAASGQALDEGARSRRLNEYRDRFDSEFARSTSSVFRTPEQQRRFNQLQMQYQGYGAFDNPRLQRQFNLNDVQRRQLQDLRRDWDSEVENLRESYATNADAARNRFNDFRNTTNQRFQGILNDQQRQSYNEMTGQPFDFGADTFLRGRDTTSGGDREALPGFNTGQSPGFNTGLNPNPANNNNTGNNASGAGTGTGR